MAPKKTNSDQARPDGRVTAKDVARSLGVSISTVSRAFTDDAIIKDSTRERVLAEASRLGYTPDSLARGLITRRSRIAGIAVAHLNNPFYPEVLASLTRQLNEHNLQIMVFFAGPGRKVDEALPTLLQYNPDVAIVLAATLSSSAIEACEQAGTPVILFNRYIPDSRLPAVCCDNFLGGQQAANLLLDGGHRRFAYISGLADTSTNVDRMRGFVDQLAARNAPPPLIEEGGDFSYQGGYDAMLRIKSKNPEIDAVFCANDIVALGALDAARGELGLAIPDDLSVVGFDDISMASWPGFSLTTIKQPADQMIRLTVGKVEALLAGDDEVIDQSFLPGEVIKRSTTRKGGVQE